VDALSAVYFLHDVVSLVASEVNPVEVLVCIRSSSLALKRKSAHAIQT